MDIVLSFAEEIEVSGMPLVKLVVNGHECYFLVDTGANICNIDGNFAREIGADEIPAIVDVTATLVGETQVSHSYSVTMTFGDIRITDIACAEADFSSIDESLKEYGLGIQGIIGMYMMRVLHGVVDMDSLTLTFRLPDSAFENSNL